MLSLLDLRFVQTSHSVNKISLHHQTDLTPENPSELQDKGTSAKFVFLVS